MNVANRLVEFAQTQPDTIAVAEPTRKYINGKRQYKTITYKQLNYLSDQIACGLIQMGIKRPDIQPGDNPLSCSEVNLETVSRFPRIALLVKPGIDFVASVFGILKSSAVMVLIDPGMGGKNLLKCLTDVNPDGFFAIPSVHAIRSFMPFRFPRARFNVTAGHRWFWGGKTLNQFKNLSVDKFTPPSTQPDDPAAIIFTTGSTGPSKGVLYLHKTFEKQVDEIARQYKIQPHQIDLPGFPMFGLFNCAMGSTAVLPDLDASRPASVDPRNIIEAVRDWQVTQSFGSPAIWKKVGEYCAAHEQRLESVKMILTAGAPVQESVMRTMVNCIHPDGIVHTPYGATEALPTATNDSRTILEETALKTRQGAGVCVGNHFPSIEWKVIKITDDPITSINNIEEMPQGEMGELIVSGPQISPLYVTRTEANATGKIPGNVLSNDGSQSQPAFWHRMGDVGYLDSQDRFWFCGRMAHRVVAAAKTFFSIPSEAIFLQSEQVNRAALVGITDTKASAPKTKLPVIIIEPKNPEICKNPAQVKDLLDQMRALAKTSPLTEDIHLFLVHPQFPVDIRHNAKIFREKLAIWAEANRDSAGCN